MLELKQFWIRNYRWRFTKIPYQRDSSRRTFILVCYPKRTIFGDNKLFLVLCAYIWSHFDFVDIAARPYIKNRNVHRITFVYVNHMKFRSLLLTFSFFSVRNRPQNVFCACVQSKLLSTNTKDTCSEMSSCQKFDIKKSLEDKRDYRGKNVLTTTF